MKRLISLIKACMTDNMSLFKIKNKNQTNTSKKILPVFLTVFMFFSICLYANMIVEPLVPIHLEYVVLTVFILFTTILTLVEGIYKSSSLLFNCKDDNLLFSLPIKKGTVLFVRIFKFYIFELFYNSLFLLPAIVVYTRYINVNITFYIVSLIALLLLPIIPIVISSIIGILISATSSKFKFKNIAQIFITILFLLVMLFISFNLQNVINDIAKNATNLNDTITKFYYPARVYIKLVTDFNIIDLGLFIAIHLAIFALAIILLGKTYFKINSKVKAIKIITNKSEYKIQTNKTMKSLIKKELNRFINSPVFVINAGFGLVLYIVGCALIIFKFDSILQIFAQEGLEINIGLEDIKKYITVIQFVLICFASHMSAITCSMISLEGRTFNILKSLPVKPYKIIISKVYTAVIIMLPFILIGDLIMFIRFKFNIIEILMTIIASIVLPMVSEIFGIIVNLKYPKMDADNDTEVVKQSMSSMVAVFGGMASVAITIFLIVKAIQNNIKSNSIISLGLAVYILILVILMMYLKKKSVKEFNNINV